MGSEIDLDVRIIVGIPRSTAASATMRTAISTEAVFGMSQPFDFTTTRLTTGTRDGSALHKSHSSISLRPHPWSGDEALG